MWPFKSRKKEPRGLLQLGRHDWLTLHQAYEGILALGGTGSGKTTTLQHLMLALMLCGTGMLFLTAKRDDFDAIARIARMAGRESDLTRFAPEEPWRFDFLNYELCNSPPGTEIANAGQLLQDLVDFSTRSATMNTNEPFWPIAAARKIRMAMTLVYHAKGKCSIEDVYNVCITMPNTPEQRDSAEFRDTYCFECLKEAAEKHPDDHDVGLALDYVLREWPRLSDKTGGCIDAYVMNLLEKFVHGSVRELVASGVSNISPADLDRRRLIVVDLPTLVGREPYQFVGMAWRLSAQRHAVRRPITPDTSDLVLWCDEAHLHALPSVDSMVQAVARSHKLIQVAITQNIPLLESVLKRREDVFAWLSNLHTWFMFANADRDTNEVCSARCGQSKQMMGGSSVNMGHADPFDDWMSTQQPQVSYSMQEHWLPDVRPEYWSGGQMRKGGSEGNFVVDVVIHQTGRKFSNGKPWIKASFRQMV